MSLLPKEDYESFLRNEGMQRSNDIVFTSIDELNRYNEKLLNNFIDYLNHQHKQSKNVFHCGARIQILDKQHLVKDYLSKITIRNKGE